MLKNRRQFIIIAISAVLAVASFVQMSTVVVAKDGGNQPRLEGVLVSMNSVARTAVVRLQNNTLRSISIPIAAKVERNGVRVSLAAFKANDRVQARYSATGATVVKFEGVGP